MDVIHQRLQRTRERARVDAARRKHGDARLSVGAVPYLASAAPNEHRRGGGGSHCRELQNANAVAAEYVAQTRKQLQREARQKHRRPASAGAVSVAPRAALGAESPIARSGTASSAPSVPSTAIAAVRHGGGAARSDWWQRAVATFSFEPPSTTTATPSRPSGGNGDGTRPQPGRPSSTPPASGMSLLISSGSGRSKQSKNMLQLQRRHQRYVPVPWLFAAMPEKRQAPCISDFPHCDLCGGRRRQEVEQRRARQQRRTTAESPAADGRAATAPEGVSRRRNAECAVATGERASVAGPGTVERAVSAPGGGRWSFKKAGVGGASNDRSEDNVEALRAERAKVSGGGGWMTRNDAARKAREAAVRAAVRAGEAAEALAGSAAAVAASAAAAARTATAAAAGAEQMLGRRLLECHRARSGSGDVAAASRWVSAAFEAASESSDISKPSLAQGSTGGPPASECWVPAEAVASVLAALLAPAGGAGGDGWALPSKLAAILIARYSSDQRSVRGAPLVESRRLVAALFAPSDENTQRERLHLPSPPSGETRREGSGGGSQSAAMLIAAGHRMAGRVNGGRLGPSSSVVTIVTQKQQEQEQQARELQEQEQEEQEQEQEHQRQQEP
eukprot:SAG11_NODE_3435_length_2449_cov_12.081633_1_plen_619_part_10